MVRSRFREHEVKKLRSPTGSRQENAIFLLILTEPGAHHKVHPCIKFVICHFMSCFVANELIVKKESFISFPRNISLNIA